MENLRDKMLKEIGTVSFRWNTGEIDGNLWDAQAEACARVAEEEIEAAFDAGVKRHLWSGLSEEKQERLKEDGFTEPLNLTDYLKSLK